MPQKPKSSDTKQWWWRVEKARKQRKDRESAWDTLLEDYVPIVKKFGVAEDVKTNAHFRNVEQKKAQLFFRNPRMNLTATSRMESPVTGPDGQPLPGLDGQPLTPEGAVEIHEEVLNYYLGPDKVNLSLLMDRLLFDALCPTGFMVSKIFYRAYTQDVKRPRTTPQLDPASGQQIEIPELDDKGDPIMEEVPILLKEEYEWVRISPRKLLIPDEFRDTDFRRAPWLGEDFTISFRDAKRKWKLPKNFTPTKGREDQLLGKGNTIQEMTEDTVAGVEIFAKAHLYRDDVRHPDVYWQIVILEGFSDGKRDHVAVVDRMSPFQEIDPETMQLTPDSMLGNPIHVGTLRDLSDQAYIPSDSAMTHAQVKELDTYRQQTVKMRDASIPKYGYDSESVTPDALHSLETGDVGQWVAFRSGELARGMESLIAPITQVNRTRTDAEGAFALEQDIEKTLGLGANQQGTTSDRNITATEASVIQQNVNVRLKKEQGRVLDYVLGGIRKFDSLLQRFADNEEVVPIVGEDNVQRLATWNKDVIAGRFAYMVLPDSQLDIDSAQQRSQLMEYYNLTAQDPFNNRKESLKKLQTAFDIDPAKGMQEPPQPGPPPPNVSFRFAGEDLFNPMVREIIAQAGYQISPQSVEEAQLLVEAEQVAEEAQPGVPGTAERLPPVSKRAEGMSGDLSGPTEGGQQ